ncbi:MAG: hypothetical protein ABI811_01125 [Acidobacteriota bacterium]
MKKPALAVSALLAAITMWAQLPAPNKTGVAAGHHIFTAKDLTAANAFWAALGSGAGELGTLKLIKFPGVLFLARQGNPAGGSEGSSVDYLGFKVKDLKGTLAKMDALGYKPSPGATAAQAFVVGPDAVKYHFVEDRNLATAVESDEVRIVAPKGAADWYVKYFGGPNIPGARLTFTESAAAMAPTKGRALDRLGFEVTDLPAFVERMKDSGVMVSNIATAKAMPLSVVTLTDPWGTFIEVSQGLEAVK